MNLQQSSYRRLARNAFTALALAGTLGACAVTPDAPTASETVSAAEPESLGEERIATILDLVGTAMREERHSDARELLERALLHEPRHERLRLANAELMLASGDLRPARDAFKHLEEEAESSAVQVNARQGQGLSAILLDRPEEARAKLNAAVAEDRGLWRAWNGLGVLADRDGDWREAETHYTTALDAAPGTPVLHNNRGYSRLLQGRTEAAIADFEAALEERPGFAAARENLRLAYAWKGRYAFATAGMSEREKGRVLNNIGYVALLRGDHRNAEAYLQQAMEADALFNQSAHKNMTYLKSLRETADKPEKASGQALIQ